MKNLGPQLKESVTLLILELQFIVFNCYLDQFELSSRLVLSFGVIVKLTLLSLCLLRRIFPVMLQIMPHYAGIMLYAFQCLLCQKLCRHKPSHCV